MKNPTWKLGTLSKDGNFAFSMAWNFQKSRLKKATIQSKQTWNFQKSRLKKTKIQTGIFENPG